MLPFFKPYSAYSTKVSFPFGKTTTSYNNLFRFLLELLFESFPITKVWLKKEENENTFRLEVFPRFTFKLNKNMSNIATSSFNALFCYQPHDLYIALLDKKDLYWWKQCKFLNLIAFDSCQDSFKCYLLTCLICRINCFALNLTLSCRWTNVRMQFSHKSYITKIRNVIRFCA